MSDTVLPSIREVLPEFFDDSPTPHGLHPETHKPSGSSTAFSTAAYRVCEDFQPTRQLFPQAGSSITGVSYAMSESINDCLFYHRSRPVTTTDQTARPARVARRKYGCHLCTWRFERPSSLANHMNSHTGAKPHVCTAPGCFRTFSTRSNMQRHLRTHHKESSMPSASA